MSETANGSVSPWVSATESFLLQLEEKLQASAHAISPSNESYVNAGHQISRSSSWLQSSNRSDRMAPRRTALEAQQLKRAISTWMSTIERTLAEKCSRALELLGNEAGIPSEDGGGGDGGNKNFGAAMVAKLQQQVWLACSTVPSAAANIGISIGNEKLVSFSGTLKGLGYYSTEDWHVACSSVLQDDPSVVKKRRVREMKDNRDDFLPAMNNNKTRTSSSTFADASPSQTLLWSFVFRAAFMKQMERLLGSSRLSIVNAVRSTLAASLSSIGLSVTFSSSGTSPQLSVSHHLQTTSFTPITSTIIFARAEAVRSVLEKRLRAMVEGVALPLNDGSDKSSDPQSSHALIQAIRVQSCILLGQILSMIREIYICLKKLEVEKESKLHSHWMESESSEHSSVLSGVLIINRLCWLMRVRGRFLDEAIGKSNPLLRSQSSNTLEDVTTNSNSRDMSHHFITLEQLRSAFDIADTDGDGVVTFEEALEVKRNLLSSSYYVSLYNMIDTHQNNFTFH